MILFTNTVILLSSPRTLLAETRFACACHRESPRGLAHAGARPASHPQDSTATCSKGTTGAQDGGSPCPRFGVQHARAHTHTVPAPPGAPPGAPMRMRMHRCPQGEASHLRGCALSSGACRGTPGFSGPQASSALIWLVGGEVCGLRHPQEKRGALGASPLSLSGDLAPALGRGTPGLAEGLRGPGGFWRSGKGAGQPRVPR